MAEKWPKKFRKIPEVWPNKLTKPYTLYLKLEGHNRASNQSISNHIDTSRIPMKKSTILKGQIMILNHPRYVYKQNTKIKNILFSFYFLLAGRPPARNSEEKIQRALARWIFSESVPTHKSMKNQGVWGGFAPPAKI